MSENLPKIIFRHSYIYDKTIERLSGKKNPKPHSRNYFINHINKLSKEWNKVGDKILRELPKVTKLKWHENEINVYITDGVISFSDPLTLNTRANIHTLTHELIHRILSQRKNGLRFHKNWMQLMNKYKKETSKASGNLRGHIVIHAIHWHILDKFFDKKILRGEIKEIKHPDYIRSWKIVKRDGYQNIIRELIKGL